jgi:hypothetical protein
MNDYGTTVLFSINVSLKCFGTSDSLYNISLDIANGLFFIKFLSYSKSIDVLNDVLGSMFYVVGSGSINYFTSYSYIILSSISFYLNIFSTFSLLLFSFFNSLSSSISFFISNASLIALDDKLGSSDIGIESSSFYYAFHV